MTAPKKAAPSTPYLTDEYEPTNVALWQDVLAVAKGQRAELTLGKRTIHAPNNGGGYSPWPHPNGTAWAIKQYKGFNGGWRRKESRLAPLPMMAKGAVVMTRTATEVHTRMQKFQRYGLVTPVSVYGRFYWDITARGVRIVAAMLRRKQVTNRQTFKEC